MADYQDDPVYRDSLREAGCIMLVWVVCLIWTTGYCYLNGYSTHRAVEGDISALLPDMSGFDRSPDSLQTPFGLGIPDWVVWGLLLPWGICLLLGGWFCFGFLRDDPQGLEPDSPVSSNSENGKGASG